MFNLQMGRSPCCSKVGLNRGAWTALEDKILTDYIEVHGEGKWRNLPKNAGLKRCGKSCRLRWLNYLRADIKRGNITDDEEDLIIRLHKLLGNRWSLIAGRLPGRTDNEIKNYWNTTLRKKVQGHPTSTSCTRNKQHSNQKSKWKKNSISGRAIERPPSPKLESQVIRTKVLGCTKVFLTPEPHNVQVEHLDTHDATTVGASFDGPASFTAGENKENSRNFMVDLNVGELCLSDFLNADFSQLCEFDNAPLPGDHNKKKELSTTSSDQPDPFFLEEMVDGWTGTHCVEPGMASDLPSLSRFLDSKVDWQGE